MEIVIFALGSAGDVHPFIGLGRDLVARGARVTVFTSPAFEAVVRRSGLDFTPVGTRKDFEDLVNLPDLWHPTRSFPALLRAAVDPLYDFLLQQLPLWRSRPPSLFIASSLAWGLLSIGETLGVPVATVHLAPSLFVSVHRQPVLAGVPFGNRSPLWLRRLQWKFGRALVDRFALPGLNRFRRPLNLPPVRDLLTHWHSTELNLALFPEWFAPPQPDWPASTRLTGFPLFDEAGLHASPPELESFLAAGPPPILFTPGSAMSHGRDFFTAARDALAATGQRGLFVTRFAGSLPAPLPPGILHLSYIPFSAVLPRCAAVVHHGGIGTTAQGLLAGIPQLIHPFAHDQFDNLSRLMDLGGGFGVLPKRFSGPTATRALIRLRDDATLASRAREIRSRMHPETWRSATTTHLLRLAESPRSFTTDPA